MNSSSLLITRIMRSNWFGMVKLGMLTIGAALLSAGCASQKLHVTTDPTGAFVAVNNAKGTQIFKGTAPLDIGLKFSSSNPKYTLNVTPPTAQAGNYLGLSTNLTANSYAQLPVLKTSKKRQLNLTLAAKPYTVMAGVEVVLGANNIWRGAVIWSRSYKDIGEAGGAVPTEICDFGDNVGIQSLALSPDGEQIVYSVATYKLPPDELQKIFSAAEPRTIDIAGANLNAVSIKAGGIQHITSENFRDMFPSYTPNGKYLLFTSNRRRPNSEDLLRISAQHRSGISDIYLLREGRLMRPTEAKDGTIAFSVEAANPQLQNKRYTIWTLGGPNQFPTQIQVGRQPAISPDGKHIAYIGADGNLWVVNTDGSQATQLTFGADKILERYKKSLSKQELARYNFFVSQFGFPEKMPFSYPSWSPDGQRILYTSMEGSDQSGRPNEDVWIMNYDGSGKQQLTTNGSIDQYPLMSPDSKWVYFMSNRGGRWAIWRIAAPSSDESSSN